MGAIHFALLIIFCLYFAGGVFLTYIVSTIVYVLIKHRKDGAPLLTFFNNKRNAYREVSLLLYTSILAVPVAVISSLSQLETSNFGYLQTNFWSIVLDFGAYLIGILVVGFAGYAVLQWYKRFREFL
ncbi:hypothetical protein M1494_03345 [Candidatus Parvarchaeota archaeon]|nr:hypothetical protein [Candidatus Parvarchaeota archaeon]